MGIRRVCCALLAVCAALAAAGIVSAAGTAGAEASIKTPLNILVLGDSYSAGNGAGSYQQPRDCYRSSKNWASRYMTPARRCGNSVLTAVRSSVLQ
jgi:hypothetical protein